MQIVIDHEGIAEQKRVNAEKKMEEDSGPGLGLAHSLKHRFVSLLAQLRGIVKENYEASVQGRSGSGKQRTFRGLTYDLA